jgi:hypothetical protein
MQEREAFERERRLSQFSQLPGGGARLDCSAYLRAVSRTRTRPFRSPSTLGARAVRGHRHADGLESAQTSTIDGRTTQIEELRARQRSP